MDCVRRRSSKWPGQYVGILQLIALKRWARAPDLSNFYYLFRESWTV